jgi:hypothetical protein
VVAPAQLYPRLVAHGPNFDAGMTRSLLDCLDRGLGFGLTSVDNQPARALRYLHAHEEDNASQAGANEKRQSPTDFRTD